MSSDAVGWPRIVIVGGGFAGLETAKRLRDVQAEVTVIDRQTHHCFQPLLYQAATAALSPADVAWPIRNILRGNVNTTVIMADVIGVDLEGHEVITATHRISYDFLVLATGSMHSYFGHDEWAADAPGLGARNRLAVAFAWAWNYVTFQRSARLITGTDFQLHCRPTREMSPDQLQDACPRENKMDAADPCRDSSCGEMD